MDVTKLVKDIVGKACWHFGYTDREVAAFEKDLLQYLEEELEDVLTPIPGTDHYEEAW